MGISEEGYVHHETYTGGMTLERFNGFLQQLYQTVDHENQTYFIFDNARCHLRAEEFGGNISNKFLPAYSPFLNPIENAFSTYKLHIKQALSNMQAVFDNREEARRQNLTLGEYRVNILKGVADNAVEAITQERCTGWFRHLNRYLPSCMNMEDIEE